MPNGHIETDVKKGYHYEKTFCDGHPAPTFAEIPEEEEGEEGGGSGGAGEGEGEGDDAEAAKNANKEVAGQWLEYYEACEKMAEEDRPGVHFHWVLDGVDPEAIAAIAESGEPDGGGEEGGEGGDSGSSECPGIDEAYDKSGCKQDCEDTYNKFINLKYSYT